SILLGSLLATVCKSFPDGDFIKLLPETRPQPGQSSDPSHWAKIAKQDLQTATDVLRQTKENRAKNAILFLGDGMGVPSITVGRILKGQLAGNSGEEEILEFERFPHTGLSKTYNTDMQTPDSAGTATAFLCGVKAKSGTMGVNEQVISRNCTSQLKERNVMSFLNEAQQLGKSVGIVTTTRITHATPGAAYSHTASRDWEDDTERNSDVPNVNERSMCPDIAEQLVEYAINYTVIFGGGRLKFLPKNEITIDPITGRNVSGSRSDSVNLINKWKQRQEGYGRRPVYLETRKELQDTPTDPNAAYFGLFAMSHLRYDLDNQKDGKEPTLEEMTRKAIEILSQNPNGFALLVEGGRIDHGHHENLAQKSMHDLLAFEKAIKAAGELTKPDDTLTIVTADHSHVFSIGGWGRRGQPIFGKVKFSYFNRFNSKGEALGFDDLPYTPLFYGDGPGAPVGRPRANITDVDTEQENYKQQAVVNFPIESHAAEDVPIYARGPGSHLFHATHEQSYIAHVIKYSLCVGSYRAENYCLSSSSSDLSHWAKIAKQDLQTATDVLRQTKENRAKNAILFLGDGMGVPSITVGRILKGQLAGNSGEEEILEFERFPHTGLSKTYNTDMQTPDSAGTATAFLCGVKAKSGTMGVNEQVISRNCTSQLKERSVMSFLNEAQQLGKSVGIVTTTRITHATPGAAYSHTASRDWEDDTERNSDVPNVNERSMCPDIAEQLVEYAINYTVIFGGGRLKFLPKNEITIDPISGRNVSGSRSDSAMDVVRSTWRLARSCKTLRRIPKLHTLDCSQ
uniref:alkaline phosphatase n=1 Tax=Macrostomum lignano TaxID=282301 RepID=A0A1I8HQU7_9PLAT